MHLRVCPSKLSKYGFCGVLALLYACRLPIPCTYKQFDASLSGIAGIVGGSKWRKWQRYRAAKKDGKIGGLTVSETLLVLAHYSARCSYTIEKFSGGGPRMTVSMWLRNRASPDSTYIIHTGKHAIYTVVGKKKGHWQMYDQSGKKTAKDRTALKCRGGLFRKIVRNIITIAPPDASPLCGDSDSDDDLPLQVLIDRRLKKPHEWGSDLTPTL